jgi:hypothetical protein
VPPDDVQLGFTVELKDGDGDAATQSFVVDIDANNDGVYDATVNAALAPLELLGVHSFNLQSPWLTFV